MVTGEIWPPPQTVDVLPTTMRHLGATVDPAWGIDGVAVGFAPSAPPVAAFGDNLIFNGDGEYERGYTGYTDVPDASLPGWSDPGYLTTVRYDSPGGYPASTDPGPASRGENFFAGGWVSEDTWATWSMDVSNLSAGIDAGASWSLSAWLGGYADQNDAATLTASFRDDADAELATATIGPVTAADRGNATGMLERTATGAVPAGTRSITVTLAGDWSEGFNDGYADNLSLVLTPN